MVQLQNPTQSSTEAMGNCAGNKCLASAAIDRDYDTVSVTVNYGNANWWQAEIMKTTQIDHVMIRTSDWAMGEGFFDR